MRAIQVQLLSQHIRLDIVGERRDDDLPCNLCDAYGDVLILQIAKYRTMDICWMCAKRLGIAW
jgi:hypothetical protein